MKKRLVINPPRAGRSTATMVTHVYNQQTRRTETVYLGSFGIALDPDTVPAQAVLQPGERAHGISLSRGADRPLRLEDIAVIRDWLEDHGTHRQDEALKRARQRADENRRALERQALLAELECELRPRIEDDVRQALLGERLTAELDPLDAAVAALDRATAYVVQRAEHLRAAGHKVSSVRKASTKPGAKSNPLDVLQAAANRIRIEAIHRFELGCKTAGTMAKRRGRSV